MCDCNLQLLGRYKRKECVYNSRNPRRALRLGRLLFMLLACCRSFLGKFLESSFRVVGNVVVKLAMLSTHWRSKVACLLALGPPFRVLLGHRFSKGACLSLAPSSVSRHFSPAAAVSFTPLDYLIYCLSQRAPVIAALLCIAGAMRGV